MSYMPAEMNQNDDDDDFEDGFLDTRQEDLVCKTFSNNNSHKTSREPFDNHHRSHNTISNRHLGQASSPRQPKQSYPSPTKKNGSIFTKQHPSQTRNFVKNGASNSPSFSSPSVTPQDNQQYKHIQRNRQVPLSDQQPDSWNSNFLTEEDLKVAAVKGNVDVVLQCLQQGIPVNQTLTSGWSALMFACSHSNARVVDLLLKEGANPSYHADLYTPLMCACSTSTLGADRLECVRVLVDAGADINAKDRQHSTGLMLSSRLGHQDIVGYLLEKGAKVNEQDARGWTALTWAVQRGHKEVVLSLIEASADCNIQHSDRLTVKDMAAHAPSDEMLALLERRPVRLSDGGDMTSTGVIDYADPVCSLDINSALCEEDDKIKATDLRYGEMEIFLLGLNLPHLVPLFKKHLIDLFLLLDMTEQDLINAGVEQVGARKKVLDAARAVHKKDWETTSLVSVHFNKCISCADAVAMVANAAKHIRYIHSTMVYIKKQLSHHPQAIIQATDQASPTQLARRLIDTNKHVNKLQADLIILEKELLKAMKNQSVEPPDLIPIQKGNMPLSPFLRKSAYFTGFLAVSAGVFIAWKNYNRFL